MKLDQGGRSITNRDLNDLELNLEPFVVDDPHKDENFQHIDDQHQSSSSAYALLDMDASQPEQVDVSSSNSNGRSHENTQQEEVISQPEEEDTEELQAYIIIVRKRQREKEIRKGKSSTCDVFGRIIVLITTESDTELSSSDGVR
ncbi:unnamed protein product [Lactuca virosa]|uniref:Uncharacterized protein n=1 Tax=Lactuca virosa TaxID=75947 RepID=A0AAU9PT43_9ASTR|nr:unnamed protein product [Lactuca virosa]